MRLNGKAAIVTGGGHGMGDAEARLFAAEGARIIVADILEHEAERVAADIRAAGARPPRQRSMSPASQNGAR